MAMAGNCGRAWRGVESEDGFGDLRDGAIRPRDFGPKRHGGFNWHDFNWFDDFN